MRAPIRWVDAARGLARGSRPGYHLPRWSGIPRAAIDSWLDAAHTLGIKSIICLLAEDQLRYYKVLPEGLLAYYRRAGFMVTHIPVTDRTQPPLSPAQLDAVQAAFDDLPKPVLVHCSAGIDRTGAAIEHLLAAEPTHEVSG